MSINRYTLKHLLKIALMILSWVVFKYVADYNISLWLTIASLCAAMGHAVLVRDMIDHRNLEKKQFKAQQKAQEEFVYNHRR